jgi:signal transduction histidine kinase
VVLNLLTNALEAAGSTELPPGRVSITTRCEQGLAFLTVADNGPGVPAELREVIFELLRGTNPHGMGLGLWLSRSIVERHGGRLQLLEGAAGQGACFEVELPRVTTAAADM